MKAFIVLAAVACAHAQIIAPYANLAGIQTYAGAGLPYAINNLGYAAGYAAPYAAGAAIAAPYAAAYAAPIAAPIAPAASQYSAQDEFGNINYGYSNINSAKHEVGNTYGGVTGSYSYVDAYGLPQTVNYVADALGFRVAGTNIPVAKSVDLAQPVFDLVGPAPVEDTDEVKAANEEFNKAFEEAQAASAARRRRSAEFLTVPASTQPLAIAAPAYAGLGLGYAAAPLGLGYAAAPLGLGYAAAPLGLGYAAPIAASAPLAYAAAAPVAITASAPAARDAIKTTIQLNPGHATAYIVNK
jgi:hypothetical protein